MSRPCEAGRRLRCSVITPFVALWRTEAGLWVSSVDVVDYWLECSGVFASAAYAVQSRTILETIP